MEIAPIAQKCAQMHSHTWSVLTTSCKLNFRIKFNLCLSSGQCQRHWGHCFCFHMAQLGLLPLSSEACQLTFQVLQGPSQRRNSTTEWRHWSSIIVPTFFQRSSVQPKHPLDCNHKCQLRMGEKSGIGIAGQRSEQGNDVSKTISNMRSGMKFVSNSSFTRVYASWN